MAIMLAIMVKPGPLAQTVALCSPCAQDSGFAGPLKVVESKHGECANCAAGRPGIGYIRCCAFCSVDILLDHEISNEVMVYCPKHNTPEKRA